ncbi:flippase [Chloroflexia bacterium SDU3-3]|nr:flippase [Chloroflexia bacterium SDU3-3]
MLTQRSFWILLISALVLPALGIAAFLWRRHYRDQDGNTARRVFKNSAIPTAMRMAVRALDLLFAFVLYDAMSGADMGKYTLAALLIVNYLSTFTDFGLGVLLTREVAKDSAHANKLFGATLALRLVLVVLAFPIVAFVIGIYNTLSSIGVGEAISSMGQEALWVLTLTLIPAAFSNAVTALYNASERMEIPAAMELVTAIVNNLARITVLMLHGSIVDLSWVAVGVTTFTALVYLGLQLRDFFPPRLVWERALIWGMVPLALPLMLNNMLNAVFFRFDTFIVKAFGGGQGDLMVQQYNAAYQITSIAAIIPSVVTFAVFPVMARKSGGDRQGLAAAQNRTLQMLLLVAFPVTVGIFALAPDLIRMISGKNAASYLPISGLVLALLAWYLPLSFVNGLLQYVLIAINQQRSITKAFVLGAVFNLAANLIGIPFFGLYAAAVVTVLSEIVLLAVFMPLLRREGLAPPLRALMWRPGLAALVMGAAMLAAHAALAPLVGWLGASVAAGAVAVVVYPAMLWLLGAVGPEERALVLRVLGRS